MTKNGKTATGIEITSTAVRVAQLVRTDDGIRALAVFSEPVPAGDEAFESRAASALASLLKKNNLHVSKAAAVLPDSEALFRNSLLPTNNLDEINGMAALEMEYFTMLPLSDINVSWFTIDPAQPGGIRAGIIAAKKTAVQSIASILRKAGVSPEVITTGGIAAANYFGPSIKNTPILAVCGESAGASIYIIGRSGLAMSGGHATANGTGTLNIEEIAASVRMAMQSAETDEPSEIVVFGETSILPSTGDMEREFGLKTKISGGDEYVADGSLAGAQRAAGAALELFEGNATGANLLSGDDANSPRKDIGKWIIRAAATAAAVLLIAFSIRFFLGMQERHDQLRALDARIASLKPKAAELAKKKKALSTIRTSSGADTGCLDTMLELSRTVPQGVYVTNMVYDNGERMAITAETASQEKVSQTMKAIEASPAFSNIELAYSRQTDMPGGALVAFEVKADIRPVKE